MSAWNRSLTAFLRVACLALFLMGTGFAEQDEVDGLFFSSYEGTSHSPVIKLCNQDQTGLTCLIISIAKSNREINLPKFTYVSRAGKSQLTTVKLSPEGENVIQSKNWYVLEDGRVIASGPIRFGLATAQLLMNSKDYDQDVLTLVRGDE